MQRIAAIDIGTQTIRLLIAEYDTDTLYPLRREHEIVGLGADMRDDCLLLPDKIEHAADCIRRFCERARACGSGEIQAVATACVRQAKNNQDFIAAVKKAAGMIPEIINEEKESSLSCAGVQAVMPTQDDTTIIIDIGGGSTEFSFLTSGCLKSSCSLPLGVLASAERFMQTDPPAETEIEALTAWADSILASHSRQLPLSQAPCIIVTAGTATTLAAMDQKMTDYVPARINGYRLSLQALTSLLHTMTSQPSAQRAEMPGLEPGRAGVIIPGALILKCLLQYFGCTGCTVSDAGLLEGIIIQHALLKKIIEKT